MRAENDEVAAMLRALAISISADAELLKCYREINKAWLARAMTGENPLMTLRRWVDEKGRTVQ